jgi:hypothetical protein
MSRTGVGPHRGDASLRPRGCPSAAQSRDGEAGHQRHEPGAEERHTEREL